MLEKKKRSRFYNQQLIIEETAKAVGNDSPTAKEVLEYMMGDDYGRCANYVVYSYDKPMNRHFIQRLNMLWVYPLVILSIPFQFLFVGQIGISKNSKIGKVVEWLVKFN